MFNFSISFPILSYVYQRLSESSSLNRYLSKCLKYVGVCQPIELLMSLVSIHIAGFRYTSHYQESFRYTKFMFGEVCNLYSESKLKGIFSKISNSMITWKLFLSQSRILAEQGGMGLCVVEKLKTLDVDWTTLCSYSLKRQGSKVGHNKKRIGEPCFQLSLALLGRIFIDSKLFPGNTAPRHMMVKHIKRAFHLGYQFQAVRGDAAYADVENLLFLQKLSLHYAIGASSQWAIVTEGRKVFRKEQRKKGAPGIVNISKGLQAFDFGVHRVGTGRRKEVFSRVIICRRIHRKKKKGKWKVRSYFYAIFTDLNWTVLKTVKYYHKRTQIENGIKELKKHYFLEHLPVRNLKANEFYIATKIFAMTMLKLFALKMLPKALLSMRRMTLLRKVLSQTLKVPRRNH